MAITLKGSDFQKWIDDEKEKINGRLCEVNLASKDIDDEKSQYDTTKRVVVLQHRHSGICSYARGYDNALEVDACLQYGGFTEAYFHNHEIISHRYIESFRIFPRGYYEETVTAALNATGMKVQVLSDLILSYLAPIFEPSNTNSNADAEPNAESNFWNNCNIL